MPTGTFDGIKLFIIQKSQPFVTVMQRRLAYYTIEKPHRQAYSVSRPLQTGTD
jgi:hypothetical protein